MIRDRMNQLIMSFLLLIGTLTVYFFIQRSEQRQNNIQQAALDLDLVTSGLDAQVDTIAEYMEAYQATQSQLDSPAGDLQEQLGKLLSKRIEVIQIFLLEGGRPVVIGEQGQGVDRGLLRLPELVPFIESTRVSRGPFMSPIVKLLDGRSAGLLISPDPDGTSRKVVAVIDLKLLLKRSISKSFSERYRYDLSAGNDHIILTSEPRRLLLDEGFQERGVFTRYSDRYRVAIVPYEISTQWQNALVMALTALFALAILVIFLQLKNDNQQKLVVQEQLRKAMQSAEQASKAKSELLANISHEIRTPLGAIKGYSDLFLEGNLRSEEKIEAVKSIKRNSNDLLELINDILDLSKVEAGLLEIESGSFAIYDVVSDVVDTLHRAHMSPEIDLEVIYDGPIPETIESDKKRVRQVLLNLLGNAIKFTEKGTVTVTIKTAIQDGKKLIQVLVQDTGIGISPDNQHKLFQSFTQADSSISRIYGGTGLGLKLSRKLARLLGGDVVLVKSELGVGSEFRFTFDPGSLENVQTIVGLKQARVSIDPVQPEKVNLAGLRILVVEDGDDNQEIFRRFLEAAHGRVTIASSGKDAIELFPSEAFDLILMDIQLPEINGYETTREIRKRGFLGPILAVTANAMKGERERCLAAQCDDYLSKPVNFERLFKMIQQHCQKKLDQDQQVILSDYQDDPRVAPLLEQYAKGLEDKVNRLRTSLVEQDWTTIRTISHQVRGSCSHYGYPILEGYFEELEEHAMQDLPNPDQMKKQIDFIEQLKDSIGSGLTMTHR